jgi:hypothetical protein
MSNVDECRAYVVHLRIEHRKLHGTLQRIQRDWPGAGAEIQIPGHPSLVIQELRELRTHLAGHFAEEEGGGCLEEAVCRCPKLGPEADRIESEHPNLLAELDDIIARSVSGTELGQPSYVAQEFQVFAQKLHAHETAENHLLEVAFGIYSDL